MSIVTSSIPGRLRLRHAALRNPVRLERLVATIADWPQIDLVEPNARTGSLLIHYAAQAWDEADFRQRCEEAALALLPAPPAPADDDSQELAEDGEPGMVRANRVAKHAMLLSLATSLVLAATGGKRWHVLTGILFLHALGVHLWTYRQRILR